MKMHLVLLVFVLACLAPATARTQTPDYAQPDAWLCRPGRTDACRVDLTTTVVAPDGRTTLERFAPVADPAIDCFYVYPTVSNDTTPNSDLAAGPDERDAAALQFARFSAVCRPFAPLYRQQTLRAMRVMLAGGQNYLETAYADVVAAWEHYLRYDNGGRGVVLIGHSQGSRMLERLLRERIDGTPVARQLVSAIIPGIGVGVAAGQDVGGTFRELPLCRTATSIGCIVTWASFRDDMTPAANSLFGRTTAPAESPACTSPAALLGRAMLHGYFPAQSGAGILRAGRPASWMAQSPPIPTPFISLEGQLEGTCVSRDGAQVLAISARTEPAGAARYAIGGDIMRAGAPDPFWGLHLLDIALVQGDLIALVRRQSSVFLGTTSPD